MEEPHDDQPHAHNLEKILDHDQGNKPLVSGKIQPTLPDRKGEQHMKYDKSRDPNDDHYGPETSKPEEIRAAF